MEKVAYIETSVPSAHESHRTDPGSQYRRRVTREWWEQEARQYELVTSDVTLIELRAGSYPGQEDAIALVQNLPRLEVTDEVVAVAEVYVQHHLMPAPVAGDALHLALASVNEVDYLLTWNLRHLANPNKVEHMTVINRRLGLLTPVILSPELLWNEDAT